MATITDFDAQPDSRADTTPAVRAALDNCRKSGDQCLTFPAGRYDFWPDRATERYLFISNNTEGLKHIAFPLFDLAGFQVEGQGAEFIFHGPVLPFAVMGSRDVRLSGFSMDWKRPFHSEGKITAVSDGGVDLEFSDEYPYKITGRRLGFVGEHGEDYPFSNVLEYDPARRETAYQAQDNYGIQDRHEAAEIGPGRVRFVAAFSSAPTAGNVLAFAPDHRRCPGIFLCDSQQVLIEDVTLHHCGGMGVIGQRSADISLRRVHVTPPPGKDRLVSLTADATHFVNCRGQIEITDGVFENQMDDPLNVHGIYAKITGRLSDRVLETALIHGEQLGIDLFAPGDTVELVKNETLTAYHAGTVTAVKRLNRRYTEVTFAEELPAQIKPGDAAVSRDANPDVTVRGCMSRGNRARGFLLSTSGQVVVENNTFHTPGAAILIAGDANYWFESGPVRDVTIRGNHFENCNYGVWGRACLDICPEIAPEYRAGTIYHRNIRIEGNTFDVFDPRLLAAYCVGGLTFTSNTVRASTAYPAPKAGGGAFAVTDCTDVVIQES